MTIVVSFSSLQRSSMRVNYKTKEEKHFFTSLACCFTNKLLTRHKKSFNQMPTSFRFCLSLVFLKSFVVVVKLINQQWKENLFDFSNEMTPAYTNGEKLRLSTVRASPEAAVFKKQLKKECCVKIFKNNYQVWGNISIVFWRTVPLKFSKIEILNSSVWNCECFSLPKLKFECF